MGVSMPPLQETGSRWAGFVADVSVTVCSAAAVGVLTATSASN